MTLRGPSDSSPDNTSVVSSGQHSGSPKQYADAELSLEPRQLTSMLHTILNGHSWRSLTSLQLAFSILTSPSVSLILEVILVFGGVLFFVGLVWFSLSRKVL